MKLGLKFWRSRDPHAVRVKYAWDVRWRLIASWLLVRCGPVLRPVLRVYDWFTSGYNAEGHSDLSLREYLGVKWCEWRGRHMGRRTSLHGRGSVGMHYCDSCQCDWKKFDARRRR